MSGLSSAETSLERLRHLDLSKFAEVRLLVAGDFMLDEYIWGKVGRISPEAPVVVVQVERETRTLGGAGNVVNNLAALGAQVEVLGLVGEDNPAQLLKDELVRLGVDPQGLFADPLRQTSRKTRVVGDRQQVVRIDRETLVPASANFLDAALAHFRKSLPGLNAVVLSDYAKGTLTPPLVRDFIRLCREHRVPVVIDPKGPDWSHYAKSTVITPNKKELEIVIGYPIKTWDDLVEAGRRILEQLGLEALLITEGAEGFTLIRNTGALHKKGARTPREVFDVSGAGDTVVAVMALGLGSGLDFIDAADLANLAAGVVVTKVGTSPILPYEIERELKGSVYQEEKIVTLQDLKFIAPHLKAQGKRIVFTNGCFDLLHVGHIKFLEDSRRLGDALVVALDADASVRRVKGEGRPVIGEEQRLRMLAALAAVDYVTLFDSEQLPEILAALKPDVLTKGSNFPEEEVAGKEIVTSYGGRVALVPISDPVSITGLINRIRQKED